MLPITTIKRRVRTSPSALKGETLFAIYRADNSPADYPWMWTVSKARNSHFTPDTIHTMLTHITVLELWAIHRGIDLYRVMIKGECLSLEQVDDLNSFLHYQVKDLRELLTIAPMNQRRFLERCLRDRPVANSSVVQRQVSVLDYLTWLGEFGNRLIKFGHTGHPVLARMPSPDVEDLLAWRRVLLEPAVKIEGRRYLTKVGSYAHYFAKNRPPIRESRIATASMDRETDRFALWLAMCDPQEIWVGNPWVARRNYLIINLLVETGMRAGELLQMKVEDYKSQDRRVDIVRRHADSEDPRPRQPQAKTRDRSIVLSDFVMDLMEAWLDERDDIDAETPKDNRNPFLFPNLDRNPAQFGRPMSKAAVDKMMKKAAAAAGVSKLTPHPLRHKKARELVAVLKENNASHEEARKVLVYHFGWSDGSAMIQRYLGGASELGAAKTMQEVWKVREGIATKLDEMFLSGEQEDRPDYVDLLEMRLETLKRAQARGRS